ncbi:MAG TPA: bifunctional riboflavin kinase/FAD synthetase [Campylobacterales bacterium]|nr:bifunctional riboflavin kinase/FAD synthetase [Campylobacterales bacterium]
MKLTNSIKSIAIGSFDGIHIAHQKLISQSEAVVIIEKNRATITTGYKRTEYINKPSFFYHFDHIKLLTAKEFIEKLKEDFPKLEKIIVGYDFAFGYKKEGNTALLQKLFNGEVIIVDEVKYNNISVHSCTIRKYITKGNIDIVNKLLNHNYKIDGKVIKGQGLGKKELVPTLNLKVYDYILPKSGVYTTSSLINNRWLPSVSFLGHRVTTDGSFAIETHIIDKDIGEIEGSISLEFISYIRGNRKFEGLDALKKQIESDIELARYNYTKA